MTIDPVVTTRPRYGRCTYTWSLDPETISTVVRLMVCDRPSGHEGDHIGRLLRLQTSATAAAVLGWLRMRQP